MVKTKESDDCLMPILAACCDLLQVRSLAKSTAVLFSWTTTKT